MAHAHPTDSIAVGTRRLLAGAVIAAALATIVAALTLWPSGQVSDRLGTLGLTGQMLDAKVVGVESMQCTSTTVECRRVELRLSQGPDTGKTIFLDDLPIDDSSTPDLREGDAVVLSYDPRAEPTFQYAFADRGRKGTLVALALLFATTVVVLGGIRGVAALAGLGASFVVLLAFVLPSILDGNSPLLVAVVGASAIAFLALYLAHGFGTMTSVALLGTLGSLALTVGLAQLFVRLAAFSGLASEEASYVRIAEGAIDLNGLILAGVVIGALGAIDDMTVTQASVVAELRAANPGLGSRRLFGAAMRVGRDHVASTVNTLALAYAGASMPLLVLFVLAHQSLGSIANSEVIAIEIVRTLVGSIGLVASVPLTTWLAVAVGGKTSEPAPS